MATAPPDMTTPVATPEVIETAGGSFVLTPHDRCDRCGAEAQMAVKFAASTMPLLFCMHHGNEHEPALGAGEIVADQREQFRNRHRRSI